MDTLTPQQWQIVIDHTRYADYLVFRLSGQRVGGDAAGVVAVTAHDALIEAARKFDPKRGLKPTTLIWRCVCGRLRDARAKAARRAPDGSTLIMDPAGGEPPRTDIDTRDSLRAALAPISFDERKLLLRLYGRRRQTLAEVGRVYGVSKSCVGARMVLIERRLGFVRADRRHSALKKLL